jgi:hypothetical protein
MRVVRLYLRAVDEHFAVKHLNQHVAKAPLPDPSLHTIRCEGLRQLGFVSAAQENLGMQWRIHDEKARQGFEAIGGNGLKADLSAGSEPEPDAADPARKPVRLWLNVLAKVGDRHGAV